MSTRLHQKSDSYNQIRTQQKRSEHRLLTRLTGAATRGDTEELSRIEHKLRKQEASK